MNDDSETSATPARTRHRGTPGLAALAILVGIVALALAGWTAWRLQHALQTESTARAQAEATLASLQHQLNAGNEQAQSANHRLGGLESSVDDMRATSQGMDRRLANLETAYATLSGQQQSGRDTLLLNDTEMLLRTARQRFELFHDSDGAIKAYAQALDVLAQVQDPAYAPVRASIDTERTALAAAAPSSRQASLDTLSQLRAKVASLPLASAQAPASATTAPASSGFWSRMGHALGGIVKVSRDDDRRGPIDPRFARQALGLDLAQAQEALLAFDDATAHNALQRADATLAAQFDSRDAAVRDARADLAGLLAQHATGPVPTLGGALAQLQALRASHAAAVAPAPNSAPASAPATAASSASHKKAPR